MNLDLDIAVMALFEQAQAMSSAQRDAWLEQQAAPAPVVERVRRLLQAEQVAGDFLDTVVATPAAFESMPVFPSVGDRLGSYELLRALAAGGMGVVYLARRADDVYRQDVAIKLIRSVHLYGDPKARAALVARFDVERMILAQLNHPNIARILDGGSTSAGIPYLVMEYVDGLPLDIYCRTHQLDVRARVRLLSKVCDGVQEAHRHLIVHRDIKPDNILVTSGGEPRLIDFGIARELSTQSESAATGVTLYSAMTPAYASPEQVRHEALTTSSDVYSLGVVLFQLVAGKRPYELAGLSPAAIERLVSDSHPPSLQCALESAELESTERRQRLQQLDPDLERILAKTLHKDPTRRYHSAEALAEDLRRWLEGQPVSAHPDSVGYRTRKFVRRHRLGVGLAALALSAVLAAVGIAGHQAVSAHRAVADTQRANTFLIDVLNLSDPYSAGGELSLGEAMARAYALVDEKFSDRPQLAADLRLTLSDAMFHSGHVQQAGEQLEKIVAANELEFGSDAALSVRALVLLAAVRRAEGRYVDSERLYQTALLRIERSAWRDDGLHARTFSDLGLLYLTQEKYAEAASQLQQAIDLDARNPLRVNEFTRAQTLTNLAQAKRGLGELDQAEALYARAQEIFESEHPNGSPQIAIVLNNRANIARRRGQNEQALELQKQAVEMHRRSFVGDHVMVLVPTINLARQYVDLDRPQEALPYASAAYEMAERIYPGTHNYRIQAVAALADTRRALGQAQQADELVQEAEAMLLHADIPPSTVEYLEIVRSDLCSATPTADACKPR